MTILVMGATGSVGSRLVERLVEQGWPVRAMTRDAGGATGLPAGVELAEGDIRRPETLPAVLDGVERAYLFSEPETAGSVVAEAVAAGVRRIVALSSIMADRPGAGGVVVNPVEQAVREADVDWTIVRPGPFAMNARNWWAHAIRSYGMVRWVYPHAALAPIHEDDVAAVVAAALAGDGHIGRRYVINGPEAITQAEQVAAIGKAIGKAIPFEEISPDEATAMLKAQGVPEEIIDKLLHLLRDSELPQESGVEEVTGRAARTFAQWAEDHADDFR